MIKSRLNAVQRPAKTRGQANRFLGQDGPECKRLSAGTKFGETRLATLFGVSRERLRGPLKRLSHDRIVQIGTKPRRFGRHSRRFQRKLDLRGAPNSGKRDHAACCRVQRKGWHRSPRRHLVGDLKPRGKGDRAQAVGLSGEFQFSHGLDDRERSEVSTTRGTCQPLFCTGNCLEPENASACACKKHGQVVKTLASRTGQAAFRATTTRLSLVNISRLLTTLAKWCAPCNVLFCRTRTDSRIARDC